jgi:hypothetical protein
LTIAAALSKLPAMPEQTPAVTKLRAFVAANYQTVQEAALELGESPSAFTAWFAATARPGGSKRAVIEAWTGGAVAAGEWLTKRDREKVRAAARMAARRRASAGGEGVAK